MEGAGFFFIFMIIAIAGVAVSRAFDSDRVRGYIESRGGKLLSKTWTPFGKGWYGDHNRIYTVRYIDADGNEHEALCKTNAFSGVYFTEDTIVRYAKEPASERALEEENERLRREIERLKRTRPE